LTDIQHEEPGSPQRTREACLDAKSRRDLSLRLRRIEGQVRGILRMIEEDAPCAETLLQIGAMAAAMEKVALLVMGAHADRSVREAIRTGSEPEKTVEELVSIVDRIR
jgi:CsoR family transcriptional regulator, copper-sensing transcriptional repressor